MYKMNNINLLTINEVLKIKTFSGRGCFTDQVPSLENK